MAMRLVPPSGRKLRGPHVPKVVDAHPVLASGPAAQIDFLLARVLAAIQQGAREVYEYEVQPNARSGVAIMRDCENIPAIELARKLIETRARLVGARDLRDAIEEVEAFLAEPEPNADAGED